MPYTIKIDDDVAETLLLIYDQMHPAASAQGLPVEERLELALSSVVYSVESTMEDRPEQEGAAVDADEMRRAIEKVVNPDIGTEYVQPTGGATVKVVGPATVDELLIKDPDNKLLMDAIHADDAVLSAATASVFNAMPKEEWRNFDKMSNLIQRAIRFLGEQAN